MRYYGLCLMSVLGLLGGTATESRAQQTTSYSRPPATIPDPVYVLNSTIIINGMLADFTDEDARQIKQIMIYKGLNSPEAQAAAPQLSNLSPAGVVDIISSKRVRSQSFSQLGRQLGVHGPLVFALNGHLLDQSTVATLRIVPAAIGQIHIVRPTPEQPATRVDIWLVLPPKTDSSRYPPGTIFIR